MRDFIGNNFLDSCIKGLNDGILIKFLDKLKLNSFTYTKIHLHFSHNCIYTFNHELNYTCDQVHKLVPSKTRLPSVPARAVNELVCLTTRSVKLNPNSSSTLYKLACYCRNPLDL
jgi:hypothetical protein